MKVLNLIRLITRELTTVSSEHLTFLKNTNYMVTAHSYAVKTHIISIRTGDYYIIIPHNQITNYNNKKKVISSFILQIVLIYI